MSFDQRSIFIIEYTGHSPRYIAIGALQVNSSDYVRVLTQSGGGGGEDRMVGARLAITSYVLIMYI